MPRAPKQPRAKPHERKKAAARDRAAMTPDEEWAIELEDDMLASCHPWQLDAVQDPSNRISLLVGRGGAKTTTKRIRAVRKIARRRRARVGYVATSRPEAERLNWEPLKQLVENLGAMDEFEFMESKMRCVCKRTGSAYEFFGADDKREINKLRGQPFDEFQVDECASHDITLLEMMLDRAVGPRLGERHGVFVLGGTPGHILRGRFYDVTRRGSDMHRPYKDRHAPEFADWIGWSSHAWNMLDIMSLPNAETLYPALVLNWEAALVEKKRQGWSDDNPIWRREYLGEWAADSTTTMYQYVARLEDGTLFNRWEPFGKDKLEGLVALERAIAALPEDRGEWLYGYGLDLGARDPFALTIKAFSPTDSLREFFHVYSFERRLMYTKRIAELLIGEDAVKIAMRGEVYNDVGGCFGLTGWPTAIVADLAGLGEDIIAELNDVYGIKIKAAEKKGKFGAIEVYNGTLVDGRMHILADSTLETQLQALQWKPDEYGVPKEDKGAANHSADSATYILRELGAMFAAAPPADDAAKKKAATSPARQRDSPPPKPKSADDQPYGGKQRRGEFEALLSDNDFNNLNDEWGNQ